MKKYKKIKNILLVIILMISFISHNVNIFADDEDNIIARGYHGSSEWRIENDGTLYIGEGVFYSDEYFAYPNWHQYGRIINRIVFEGDATAYGSQSLLFFNLRNVRTIEGLDKLDTSSVTDMSEMFANMQSLEELDVSNFVTDNVTNMSYMFSNMWSLEELDVSNFVTDNVTNMSGMFSNMWSLKELDVTNFVTDNVTNMSGMFSGTNLTEIDVSNFVTDNVTNMSGMFSTMPNLRKLDLSNFVTDNVTSMHSMFFSTSNLEELDLSNFNTDNVTDMSTMFSNMSNLRKLDLSNFNANTIYMSGMFFYSFNLRELTLSEHFEFYGTPQLSNVPIHDPFTGYWQHTENEDIVLTSAELMATYNGETMKGTYVWSTRRPLPVYTTDVTVIGNGNATANPNDAVAEGHSVTLTATPNEDNYFKGWIVLSGNIVLNTVSETEATFNNNGADVEVIAVFDNNPESQLIANYLYTSNDFTIGISKVEGLTDALLIEKANLLVTDIIANTPVEMEVLESNIVEAVNSYQVTFTDTNSKTLSIEITVTVVDDIAPVITATKEIRLEVGSELPTTWTELFGVTATDNVDTELTINYTIDNVAVDTSDIDMSVLGTYEIIATVTDSSGNTSTELLTLIVEAKATIEEETNNEETVINENNTNTNDTNNNQTTTPTGDVNNIFTMLGLLIISISSIILVLNKKLIQFKK